MLIWSAELDNSITSPNLLLVLKNFGKTRRFVLFLFGVVHPQFSQQ